MGLWRQVGFTTRWLARPVDKTAARIPAVRAAPDISPTSIESNCNQRVLSPVMLAKAGIQHGFDWTLNSRLRGNDTMIECDSI